MTKKCCTCKQVKDISHFVKSSQQKDGYYSVCRECSKHAEKQRTALLIEQRKNNPLPDTYVKVCKVCGEGKIAKIFFNKKSCT